jgi:hypothetical protein
MCGGGGGGGAGLPAGQTSLFGPPPPPPPPTQFVGTGTPGFVGGRRVQIAGADQDIPGITELAYGLMAERTDIPEQQVAGLTPDQQRAFQLARGGVGSFQPFLNEATGLTQAGVGALEQARMGTMGLAGQIPGQIAPGQASLRGAEGLTLGATGLGVGQLGQAGRATQALGGRIPGVVEPARADISRAAQTGMGGVGLSEAQTRQFGSQIPGQVSPGQEALAASGRMAGDVAMGGIGALMGTGAGFDPRDTRPFMSEFEDAAVQQALADIRREGEIAGTGLRAQAVGAGAFGGSRQAVAEQELQRNIMEQQGRTAAQMRAAGFESAAQRSQAAFEEAMRRQQAAASVGSQIGFQGAQAVGQAGLQGAQLGMTGLQQQRETEAQAAALAQTAAQLGISEAQLRAQLGLQGIQTGLGAQQQFAGIAGQQAGLGIQGAQAAGNLGLQASQLGLSGIQAGLGAQQQAAGLGQGIAGLGQQFAGLGQAQQQMGLQDLNTLLTTGQQQQRQTQAELDAQRANQMQTALQPFQQLAFASDIITGAPSGQMSTMTQPGPSVGSQLVGLGMAAPSLVSSYQTLRGA